MARRDINHDITICPFAHFEDRGRNLAIKSKLQYRLWPGGGARVLCKMPADE